MATAAAATTTTSTPLKIGIDFGGVLVIHDKHRTSEDDEHEHRSTTINMPDAITSLIKLKEYGHQLYLISFCGRRRAIETNQSILKSMPENLFDGIYFVKRTSYKADVCRRLGCDLMIDDTLKILNNIHRLIPTIKLIWFTSSDNYHSSDMIKVNSWTELIQIINEDLIHQAIRHDADSKVLLDEKIHNV